MNVGMIKIAAVVNNGRPNAIVSSHTISLAKCLTETQSVFDIIWEKKNDLIDELLAKLGNQTAITAMASVTVHNNGDDIWQAVEQADIDGTGLNVFVTLFNLVLADMRKEMRKDDVKNG